MRTSNRSRGNRPIRRPNSAGRIEPLEPRTLLNATMTGAIAPVTVTKDAAPTTIDLNAHFDDPTIVGTAVVMKTTQGDIPLTLFDSQTPLTVANFLNYVNSGEYNGTVIHRAIAGYVLQGGSYLPDQSQIPQGPPVPSEHGPSNTVGTIAAALTSAGPGSATSGWFINLGNNSSVLDGTANGGPFTVFGTVIYDGMSKVVQPIANLPKQSVPPNFVPNNGDPGPVLPLQNWDGQAQDITPANYVTITSVQVVSKLAFKATSDNPAVVVPTISNGMLSLNYQPGQVGSANITVTATDLGGHTVTTSFKANVGAVLGSGGARQIRFIDFDGTRTTLSLAGPGSANVEFIGQFITESLSKSGVLTVSGTNLSGLKMGSIALTGTSADSTLNVSGVGGDNLVEIEGPITSDGDLRAINAPRGSIFGDNVTIAGSVGRIQLASATGGTITVNGSAGTLSLVVGTATDESVNSSEAIASVRSTSWAASVGGGTSSLFTAPSVGHFTVRQELNTSVMTGSIASVSAGSITGALWSVSGAVTTLTAGSITGLNLSAVSVGRVNDRGAATNVTLNSAGDIRSIAAQSFSGSRIEAGSPTVDASGIPIAFAGSGTISSVTVGRGGFGNSVIGAPSLGRVNLGPVTSANGGTPFGAAAHSIASLLATVDGKRLSLRNVSSADQVTAALTSAGITPNDLVIRIV